MTSISGLAAGSCGHQPRKSSWLTALGICVALGMLALGGEALRETRNDVWKQAQQSARNLLLALDRDIERNVTILDLSLQGVSEALAEPGIGQASLGVRHHALFDRSASAEDLGSILVADEGGNVVEDSTSSILPRPNVSNRDFFIAQRDFQNAGLYLSRPFRSRRDGDLRFAISRRLSTPEGLFDGVVVGTLRLSYFRHLFEKLELGSKSTITLLRLDGRILMRYPFVERDIDRDVSQADSFRSLNSAPAGQYVTEASIDGVERLYTFRRIGHLPLILTINLSTAEIYAPWWRKAMVLGPVLVLLSAAAMASCLLFRREVLRRAVTERALAKAVDELAVIAATDGLTGVANRRTFDLELDRAFRRAVRTGTPLAVLMMDADAFKRYNDTYGHPAGDEVLRGIAGCVGRNLRRPDDIGARYGGEEFVAILPNTDLVPAASIADRMRTCVEDLGIEHSGSDFGRVTVSVGVAAALPLIGDNMGQLVQAADEALYAAKQGGRNCVRSVQITTAATLTDILSKAPA